MKQVQIFYQVEGAQQIQEITATDDESLGAVKSRIAEKHGLDTSAVLFLEDADEAPDETTTVNDAAGSRGARFHVHRCRSIAVTVAFGGRKIEHRFGPNVTIARLKAVAAEKFGMSPQDAAEHVLQIAGTHDRPTPGTHLGALATCPTCRVAFDLVPEERVNGAPSP